MQSGKMSMLIDLGRARATCDENLEQYPTTKTSGTKFNRSSRTNTVISHANQRTLINQPSPAAVRLLVQSRHSTGEKAYMDRLI